MPWADICHHWHQAGGQGEGKATVCSEQPASGDSASHLSRLSQDSACCFPSKASKERTARNRRRKAVVHSAQLHRRGLRGAHCQSWILLHWENGAIL